MINTACLLLFLALTTAVVAQESINSTTDNSTIINESNVNNVYLKNDSIEVIKLMERFSRLVELTNATSEQCRNDSRLYLDSLNRLEIWALKMFDATAKPPSGILNGNGMQFGDFDECLSIDGDVKGQYCLASLQVSFHGHHNMKAIDYSVHSGHVTRNDPRYWTSLLWGICIPNSCSNYDLETELSQRLSGIGISVEVHSTMCTMKDLKTDYSYGKLLTITYLLLICLLLSLGTILDDGQEGLTKFEKLLNAFSLKRNLRSLYDFSDGPTKVKGLDAYRGINSLLLIITHKILAIIFTSFVNKLDITHLSNSLWSLLFRDAVLYVDSFLYISGFLNANSLLQELEQKGTINFIDRFISRWFRLLIGGGILFQHLVATYRKLPLKVAELCRRVESCSAHWRRPWDLFDDNHCNLLYRLFPLFMSTMVICTYILPDINNGPLWNMTIKGESRICQESLWRSIFFIHNYFSIEEMCLPHSHQIAMDMQLYVITIPLVVVIWKSKALGWSLLAALAAISTTLRYLATYWYYISMFVYSGIEMQNVFNMFTYSYTLSTHKATIYLIGVVMAYFIKYKTINVTLSNTQSRLLWFFCFGLGAVTMMSPYKMIQEGYQYEHFPAALFATFSPISWGLFIGISHWAICNDYAGIGTSFLESRVFKFYQKISYSVYLIHPLIFLYFIATQRNATYFSVLWVVDIPEMVLVLVLSIIATVSIEMPFTKIYKIYFGNSSKKLKDN